MRTYQKGWIIFSLLMMLCCMPSILLAATDDNQLDAVLVIDASGSMQETDPNKLGLEGVKLFVDMMGATGNQVGIVTYGSSVNAVYPMTEVESQQDKEHIKAFVDSLTRDLDYTDITAGLGKAIEMENQRDTSLGNNPLIIIFTDGNNAVGGVAGRDNQKINADLAVMLSEAQAAGYPIYTIGLNDNGKLNENYLKNISEQTGALAFATKDPNELPDILTQIFAAHSNLKVQSLTTIQGTGDFEEVSIEIPNNNVLEANISATASGDIDFKLVDPNGNSKDIPSSDVTLHESQSYHLLKVLQPIEGEWKLYVKGMAGDQINIDLIYNYDIEVTMAPLSSDVFSVGDTLETEAYLSIQGSPIDDDSIYQSATATLVVTNTDTGVETKESMSLEGQKFKANYKLQEEGNFEVSILVEDTSYQRKSSPIKFTVGEGKANPSSTTSSQDVESDEEETSPLVVVAIVVGILLIIAIIIIVLKQLKEARRPLVGQIVVELKDNATGKLTPPQFKNLSVFQGKVSLHALLQFAPELKAAEDIILKSAAGDKVILMNKSAYVIEKSGRVVKADAGVLLKKGDKLSINMADSGQTVQIEYLL